MVGDAGQRADQGEQGDLYRDRGPDGGVRGEPLEQGKQFEAGQRDGQAKRSEEIDGTANQWQPAQVAIEPGGTVTFRIAGGQTHPVGSGQAPPEDRRFDASKCQPRTSPRSGTLAR